MADIRVLVVDDHAVVRHGLRSFLDLQPGISVVGEASDGAQALTVAGDVRPDVVLIDLVMPVMDGVTATRAMKAEDPSRRVVVLTSASDDESVLASLRAGADGYLLKDASPADVVAAIHSVHAGEPLLHPEALRRLTRALGDEQRRPEGTVTLLFTDVQGSTRIVDELGDEAALKLFEGHRRAVREAVRRSDGHEVSLQGDGFLFAFASARRAVDCAIEIQRLGGRLRVRIGLNTGEVIAQEDGYFGRSVFLAARVAAEASAGQILIAGTTRALLPDLHVREAGRCRLKGLPGEHPLYEVLVPGSQPAPDEPSDLTGRELEVLALIARGRPNREIAAALHLSEKTVKTHVSNILAKLGVADRTQAALLAVRRRLVPTDNGE
jgi:two-component system, NarL family, response regulator LiaR